MLKVQQLKLTLILFIIFYCIIWLLCYLFETPFAFKEKPTKAFLKRQNTVKPLVRNNSVVFYSSFVVKYMNANEV